MNVKKGRCLCGDVTFEYEGAENWCGHCHCESCRRQTASPFTTFIGVPLEAYRYTGKEPACYESSPGVRRWFCANCGAPVAYEAERFAGEIHFYAALLENPDAVTPQFHVHCAEKLAWLELADELPKHARTSSG